MTGTAGYDRGTMHPWRVSRYDPKGRDASGAYREETWTSVHDIGKMFAGQTLTAEAYLRAEQSYVRTVGEIHLASGAPALRAIDVEAGGGAVELEGETFVPREGERIPVSSLAGVVRACLREMGWCRIEADDRSFGAQFGYDFYLYAQSSDPCTRALAEARGRGLFVEVWPSPYL